MKKMILLVAVMLAFSSVASAAIITSVVRANGEDGNRDIIGPYEADTSPLRTTLEDGTYIFSDRTYTFPSVHADLIGAEYIQTFNSDKGKADDVTYAVTLSTGAIYAIGIDDRFDGQQGRVDSIASFAAAGTFADSGYDLVSSEDTPQTFSLFMTTLPAGTYTFSGAGTDGKNFMVMGAIPEPATLALLGFGGLALLRKKR